MDLHAFWDGMFGKSKNPSDAVHTALVLEREIDAKTVRTTGTEQDWALESRKLAQTVAYPAEIWTYPSHGSRWSRKRRRELPKAGWRHERNGLIEFGAGARVR